jgi:hypothetical protein
LTSYTNKFCSLPFNNSNVIKKTFNLVKEQRGYGLFYVKGFMFGDRFVKIVSNFEIKLFCHYLVAFGFQRSIVDQ